VDKPRRTQTQMYLGHLGLRADEPGYFPVAILNAAFGGTYTARLGEEIRQRRGWSYGIYSRMLGSRLRDAFYVWSFPAREHAVDCLELEMRMLGDLASGGLEPEEFEFARDHLHNHFLFAVETPALRVALAVRERVLGLESGFYDRYRERVLEVEPDEVRAHAARFVDTGAPSCAMLCDADEMQQRIRDRLGDGPLIDVMDWTSDV